MRSRHPQVKTTGFTSSASRQQGFTIIETLIVLAVTGFLVVAVIGTIASRQNGIEFSSAVKTIESELQTTISEVSSGYYPNDRSFKCERSGGEVTLTKLTIGVKDQGTNQGCVFLGKVLQFSVGSDAGAYNVYTLAGLQSDAQGVAMSDLTASKARLIAQADGEAATVPDNTASKKLQYSLTTTAMYYNASANQIAAFGFVSHLGSTLDAGNGGQQVDLVAFKNTALGRSAQLMVADVKTRLQNANYEVNPSGGVHICLKSGGTNQSALINIGGNGRQLTVDSVIKSGTTCS